MAQLTGFRTASEDARNKANASNTIARGSSPFQHNVVFTITGFSYEQAEIDGKVDKDARLNPVLVTNLGSLFLSTLLRSHVAVEKQNGIDNYVNVTPNGTFNDFVRKTISENSSKSNGEILQLIVDGCKDKKLIIERVPYTALAKDGRPYSASLVNINFVD